RGCRAAGMGAGGAAGTMDHPRRRSRLKQPYGSTMHVNARILTALLVGVLCAPLPAAADAGKSGAPFTVEDLVRMKRVSDPQVSPDGAQLVYVQREPDMEANKGRTSLWLIDAAGKAEPQRLTTSTGNDSSPRWSP